MKSSWHRSNGCDRRPARVPAGRARARGDRHVDRTGSAERVRAARRRAGRARPARPRAPSARPCSRRSRTRSSTRRPLWRTCDFSKTLRQELRPRRTGCGRRARTTCSPPPGGGRRAGSSPRASQAWRYARIGGPVKTEDDPLDPTPPEGDARDARGDRTSRRRCSDAGGIALRYGGFYGADIDGLRRAGAQAEGADRRRRRRRVVVRPPRRRGGGDRARARARPARRLQRRGRRARAGARVAPRARRGARREAAAAGAGLAREAVRRRGRRHDDDGAPRRVEREGEARARLDAPLPELAAGRSSSRSAVSSQGSRTERWVSTTLDGPVADGEMPRDRLTPRPSSGRRKEPLVLAPAPRAAGAPEGGGRERERRESDGENQRAREPPTRGSRAPCRARDRAVDPGAATLDPSSVRSSTWIVAVRASAAVAARLARSSRSCACAWARRSRSRARSAVVSARSIATVSAAICARSCSTSRSSPSSDSCRSWICTLWREDRAEAGQSRDGVARRSDGTLSVTGRGAVGARGVVRRDEVAAEVAGDRERALRRLRERVRVLDRERERRAVALCATARRARAPLSAPSRQSVRRAGRRASSLD